MSSFKCSFVNEFDSATFEITVRQEQSEDDKLVGKSHVQKKMEPPKLVVESSNFSSDPVKVKFKVTQIQTIIAYLRLLLRTHMEEVFEESLESIQIDHIGGQIRIFEYPNFHYFTKLNYLRDKKHECETFLFHYSATPIAVPTTPTAGPLPTGVGVGTGVAPAPIIPLPAPQTVVPAQPDMSYYTYLQKYERCSQKLVKIYKKHQKEVETIKYVYLDKMIGEVSKIFQDLIVLIQDSHEFS